MKHLKPGSAVVDDVTNTFLAEFPIHCVFRDSVLGQPYLHSHRGYEIYLCLSGSGRFLAGDRVHTVTPGTMIIVRPTALHLSNPDRSQAFHRYILSVDEAYLTSLTNANPRAEECLDLWMPKEDSAVLHFNAKQTEALRDGLRQLEKELEEKAVFFELSAASLLLQIITRIGRFQAGAEAGLPDEGGSRLKPLVERMLGYFAEHYQEEIRMDDLAHRLNLSRSYMYRMFKQQTGYAPNEYLTALRINKAKSLLLQTGLPIIEIAARSGFNDLSHFCHTFKKMTRMPPQRFRSSSNPT